MMNADLTTIATIGWWSSFSSGLFTSISAITICPLLYTFNSNASITYFSWLVVASSYFVSTICNKYVVKQTQKNITDAFYADLAVAYAAMYACYECAVYYLQLTYVVRRATEMSIATSLIRDEPGTPIFAIDLLGYFWLSVSTIFLALSMEGRSNATKNKFLVSLLYFHGMQVAHASLFQLFP